MDTRKSILHKHPLFHSPRFVSGECDGCHVSGPIYGGYFCCEFFSCVWFHKECAEAPLEINHHPSHTEHPLLLTSGDSRLKDDALCDACGQKLLSPCYICLTCDFKVDLLCGIKPSPSAIEHPVCHDHPLVFLKKREEEAVPCEVCKESIGGPSYSCPECNNVYFHLDCVHLSKEVNHPCHSSHPLKITAYESLKYDNDADKICHFCCVPSEKMFYHCSVCNFTVCLGCTKRPPPLVVDHPKTHTHPVRLFSSRIGFTCKLCGLKGRDVMPYICLECDFLVHGECIHLPQVININSHDHRISFTHHLGHRRMKCGVCRKSVSHYYGAYCCSVCPNYVVHSRCVIDIARWDGKELEGTPEIVEDNAPFKVVGHNQIRHFLHDQNHTLVLLEDYVIDIHEYGWVRCAACIRPIGFLPIYMCLECPFYIHEKCANLPMKKKLEFDPFPYILKDLRALHYCKFCGVLSDGFKYTSQGFLTPYHCVDVHCASISEPLVHNGHSHPLYFYRVKNHCCGACERYVDDYMLHCDVCDFYLCLYCASLPEKIWHRSDEHPLTLYYGRKASSGNWCEICEMELDPSKWFFTCSDCGVTFHVQCVLGDLSRLNPIWLLKNEETTYEVFYNNHNTRPLCRQCHSRCTVPVILEINDGEDNGYLCSISCYTSFSGVKLLPE